MCIAAVSQVGAYYLPTSYPPIGLLIGIDLGGARPRSKILLPRAATLSELVSAEPQSTLATFGEKVCLKGRRYSKSTKLFIGVYYL